MKLAALFRKTGYQKFNEELLKWACEILKKPKLKLGVLPGVNKLS
jgi:hypothetical protein